MSAPIGRIEQILVGSIAQESVRIGLMDSGITIIQNIFEGGSEPVDVPYVAQTSVQVMHNRGYKPFVKVLDEFGSEVITDVDHNSDNDFFVTFAVPSTGTIIYL